MKTLRQIIGVVLTLAWIIALIAILPLAVIGAFYMKGSIFLSAMLCALLLLGIPMLAHLLKKWKPA
jgi:hypothetical protein